MAGLPTCHCDSEELPGATTKALRATRHGQSSSIHLLGHGAQPSHSTWLLPSPERVAAASTILRHCPSILAPRLNSLTVRSHYRVSAAASHHMYHTPVARPQPLRDALLGTSDPASSGPQERIISCITESAAPVDPLREGKERSVSMAGRDVAQGLVLTDLLPKQITGSSSRGRT